MPEADAEDNATSEKPTSPAVSAKKDDLAEKDQTNRKEASTTAISPQPAEPLKWPATTSISEDDKKLLQSNNKEIVQLFTLAQEVCKNMDNTLDTLSTQRDEANTKYRSTVQDLDPLLQRIGAAQAENKNP